ncbi:unnamed protein product [Thlaspi arvense]|uniref:TIR domain-containing protein n=1 Tax=Thlaspi arvense TaxID=13288 RepID=A0AAU9RM67_THLAR|nr:unnamed protein product [Thlaspi arvense]
MELAYSSYSVIRTPQYQVFINFRGAELRHGFLKTLVKALKDEHVNVYTDEDEVRGETLKILFDRIAESRIAIKECMDRGKLRVFPVFYNVETDDVKDLTGIFGENFRQLRLRYPHKLKRSAKWETALKCVSGKLGLPSELRYLTEWFYNAFGYRSVYEEKFAKSIAEEVKKMLIKISEKEAQLAEAKRNSLSRKIEEMIISVKPKGVMVFLIVMLVAPYLLLFICGTLYFTGSFDNQSKLNGRWVNDDRVVIL